MNPSEVTQEPTKSNTPFLGGLPYYSFNQYLKKFGKTVWRVPLEANFTCPNRDGNRGYGGCTFCTVDGSSAQLQDPLAPISEQLIHGIAHKQRRYKADKFIAYLQSYTNTYGPLPYLKSIYDEAINHPDIVMLCIGTRPDALSDPVLELIASYAARVEVWLDLGLQSIHEGTLTRINRGHTAAEYTEWVHHIKTHYPMLKICAHMIAGFPWESIEDAYQTGVALAKLPIDGLKIHNLLIFKESPMEKEWQRGLITEEGLLGEEEYMQLVMRILTIMPPEITIHRLQAEAPQDDQLIAPRWSNNKDSWLATLRSQMVDKGLYQGCQL